MLKMRLIIPPKRLLELVIFMPYYADNIELMNILKIACHKQCYQITHAKIESRLKVTEYML